jgi:hypothetical protein
MNTFKSLLLVSLALACVFAAYTPRYLGTFNTENPAFFANDNSNGNNNLFISSFSGIPWTSGKIWYLDNFGSYLKSGISAAKSV